MNDDPSSYSVVTLIKTLLMSFVELNMMFMLGDNY